MKNKKAESISFEDQLARLEEIVQTLDDGTAPLEELLSLYEEGMKLTENCRTYLESAEQRITEIKKSSPDFKRLVSNEDEELDEFDEEEIEEEIDEIDDEEIEVDEEKHSNNKDIGLPF